MAEQATTATWALRAAGGVAVCVAGPKGVLAAACFATASCVADANTVLTGAAAAEALLLPLLTTTLPLCLPLCL